MAEPELTLDDLDDLALQRIVDAADASDLFLLRQVARRWRACANERVQRCWLGDGAEAEGLLPDIGAKFPNLTELTLASKDEIGSLKDVVTAARQLPRLRSLAIALHCCEGVASAQEMESLSQLTYLELFPEDRDPPAAAAALSLAAQCSALQRLHLSFIELPWPALHATITALSALTNLSLKNCWMSGNLPSEGLLALNTGKLLGLRITLMNKDALLPSNPLPSEVLGQLAAFTSLTALDLSESDLEDAGVWQLSRLTRLTSLNLQRCFVDFLDVARLAPLSSLADLRLAETWGLLSPNQGPDLRAALAAFPRLRHLELTNCDVRGDEPLGALPHLTRLMTHFYINSYRGVLHAPRLLRGLTQLQDLRAAEAAVHGPQLRHLSALVKLTRLDLSVHAETEDDPDDKLSWLSGLTALQCLLLRGGCCCSGDLPLHHLSGLTALRVLDLHSAGKMCDLRPLERLPLQWLRLPQESAGQLPPGLQVAAMKGRRPCAMLADE